MLEKLTEAGLATLMRNHARAQQWSYHHAGAPRGGALTLDVCYFSDMIESMWGFKQAQLRLKALMAMLKIGSLSTLLQARACSARARPSLPCASAGPAHQAPSH